MRYSLAVGLVLRRGMRTFEFVRELSAEEVQLEDVETRRPLTIRKWKLISEIEAGTYSVVLSGTADSLSDSALQTQQTISLPESQQKLIDRRYAYVIAMRKAGITRGSRKNLPELIKKVAGKLEDKHPPSSSTVLDWARRYEASNNNVRALASRNYSRRKVKRITPIMEELIREKIRTEYLTRNRHSLKHTHQCIVTAAKKLVNENKLNADEATVSISTLGRWVQELDRYEVIKRRYGTPRARLLCRTPMGDDYPELPFEQVEADHTPLDWIVICDRTGIPLGRPLLTATICAATGYPTGLYLSFYGPGLTSVSGVLRNTISLKDAICRSSGTSHPWLASGIPDLLLLDNGLEFHAHNCFRIGRDIGMDITFAAVRTPWSKPHIERFFASLGYLTLTTGRIRKRITNVIDLDPRTTASITFSNLVKGLVQYFVDVHPFRIHERKLARPFDLMSDGIEKCPPASYLPNFDAVRMATAISKTLTVSQGGVEIRGIPFGSAELSPMRRAVGENFRTLVKWDPDDIDQIYVQHPITKEWICSPSRWPQYTQGLSWNQHLLIRKFLRKQLKAKNAEENYITSAMRLHEFWMDVTTAKTATDAKLAGQFAGLTSARVLDPKPNSASQHPQKILVEEDEGHKPTDRSPPDFEAFIMEGA